ncbi:hypothetical protein ADK59_38795 [Streptomyces sp. XY332]|nr:hypothetical protein ADK59_38795 [Streptomyces sp. XY332]
MNHRRIDESTGERDSGSVAQSNGTHVLQGEGPTSQGFSHLATKQQIGIINQSGAPLVNLDVFFPALDGGVNHGTVGNNHAACNTDEVSPAKTARSSADASILPRTLGSLAQGPGTGFPRAGAPSAAKYRRHRRHRRHLTSMCGLRVATYRWYFSTGRRLRAGSGTRPPQPDGLVHPATGQFLDRQRTTVPSMVGGGPSWSSQAARRVSRGWGRFHACAVAVPYRSVFVTVSAVGRAERALNIAEEREALAARRRAAPEPPAWLIEHGIGAGRLPVRVHARGLLGQPKAL